MQGYINLKKNIGATSKLQAAEGWHKISSALKTQKY
jgi:hypothetical protein